MHTFIPQFFCDREPFYTNTCGRNSLPPMGGPTMHHFRLWRSRWREEMALAPLRNTPMAQSPVRSTKTPRPASPAARRDCANVRDGPRWRGSEPQRPLPPSWLGHAVPHRASAKTLATHSHDLRLPPHLFLAPRRHKACCARLAPRHHEPRWRESRWIRAQKK